jgi:hypothetical protein
MTNGLRSIIINNYSKENYCNLINVTTAILGLTSKMTYAEKIPCINQNISELCNNINNLFSTIYVIPNPQFIKVTNLLHDSLINTLNCNKIEIKNVVIKNLHFNFKLIPIAIVIYLILKYIYPYINRKYK